MRWAAAGLAITEAATIGINSASMMAGSTMGWPDLLSASFLHAEALTLAFALLLGFLARFLKRNAGLLIQILITVSALALLSSIVYLSHAVSQMNHRLLLVIFTALHHLGTVAWLGAMPYLIVTIRSDDDAGRIGSITRRYSWMALVSVVVLVAAGIGMAWFYVGSTAGLYGTSYGLMLLAKIYLLGLMLTLGAGNWYLLRRSTDLPTPLLLRLRRFSEAEIGLGFTVLLAAASLTAQSPSSEVTPQEMVSAHAYRVQLAPRWPRLESPPFHALTPPSSMREGVEAHQFGEGSADDANDKAWSDYNHHWAGVLVLLAGSLALLHCFSGRWPILRWARYWPISFAGLAFFIVLRADPEAWPLGPRPFWASFSYPDVLEHRVEALLVIAFAVFEAAVQAGKLRQRASLVFPLICAFGAALLLTHSHGLGDGPAEVLAEASHTLIAVLGATVACSRWLQLRLATGRPQRIAAMIWPAGLILVSLVLLNYREV
jgi:putative copper resistance protein D